MVLGWVLTSAANAAPGYFRSPALHGETVIFTAEGDLWNVPVTGGAARRLTSHPGLETHATISRDGTMVAFSGQYEGPTEIYVMPLTGGLPKRLTWHGEGAKPVGWTPDGKVLCASRANSTLPNDQLVAIDPATGAETAVPLAQASDGVLDDSGKRLFFTRLPFQGSNTKRYQGGTVQNLWRFDEGAAEAVPLTGDFAGTSKRPMWWQDRVYFLSDRSGNSNLWSMAADGTALQPLTHHQDFEIRTADQQGGRIIYQMAGTLRLISLVDGNDGEIPITLPSDFDQTRERWVSRPFDYLTRFNLSPEGDRLVLTARGSVFVVPVKEGGRPVDLPRKPGVRYREATFLPNGTSVLAQTDETGEIEFARMPANGLGEPELLTQDGTIFRFAPVISPDGARIAWQDKNLDLWVRDLAAQQTVKVATSKFGQFRDLEWSPDSKWLAFVESGDNTFPRIRLYQVSDGALIDATGERVMSQSPTWSADGKWLYFLSDRELRTAVKSPWGPRQPEPYFTESTRIYALALKKGEHFPFHPQNELAGEAKKSDADGKPAPKVPEVVIDREGLAQRLYEVPGISGNLGNLVATPKHLFYTARDSGLKAGQRLVRLAIDSNSPKPLLFAGDLQGWDFSGDGKSVALRKDNAFYVVATAGDAPAKLDKAVPLDGWSFPVDPREEWRQIFTESWRMLRDYFYDPAMHGVDWVAIRKKYEPLVERVADRADLGEILQEMAGELSALHMYVGHGDLRSGPSVVMPSVLGARFSRDAATAGWRVDHIFASDPDYPGEASPLARPEVQVQVGDVIRAINGRALTANRFPAELLARKAGQPVLLQIQSGADGSLRNVMVNPILPAAAKDLRYGEWEYTRRLQTEELGGGKIGYVHLRSMGADSILEWARNYYPVFNRQGLIIDVRHNTGGNTDSWILGRLLRKAWFLWSPRAGESYWNMQFAFRGHLTVLCDEWTSSDGEAFAEGFRRLGMGKIFGTRTWGGQIWLNTQRWLVDNGMCTAAEIGVYGPEGQWLIEGTGVDPDEVVDNLPHATFQGTDAQLQRAIGHLLEEIEKDPRPMPAPPPRPNKAGGR
jgi:tricorn protease